MALSQRNHNTACRIICQPAQQTARIQNEPTQNELTPHPGFRRFLLALLPAALFLSSFAGGQTASVQTSAPAPQQVDPRYLAWSSFKIGASVTTKTVQEKNGKTDYTNERTENAVLPRRHTVRFGFCFHHHPGRRGQEPNHRQINR